MSAGLVVPPLPSELGGVEHPQCGSCVPIRNLVSRCTDEMPELLVLSSVNGHGHNEAVDVIRAIRRSPSLGSLLVVIGGNLGIDGEGNSAYVDILLTEGFDAVFDDGSVDTLHSYLAAAL